VAGHTFYLFLIAYLFFLDMDIFQRIKGLLVDTALALDYFHDSCFIGFSGHFWRSGYSTMVLGQNTVRHSHLDITR
jgi:hypothetical protein